MLPLVICTVKLLGLLCTAHDGLPFVPLPLKLNVLPFTASWHCAAGADPALAVGSGLTVPVATAGQVIGMEFNVAVIFKVNEPTLKPPALATTVAEVPVTVLAPPEN